MLSTTDLHPKCTSRREAMKNAWINNSVISYLSMIWISAFLAVITTNPTKAETYLNATAHTRINRELFSLVTKTASKINSRSCHAAFNLTVLKIYVYNISVNDLILKRNWGWVSNPWNQHNQYIPEYVIHQNILNSEYLTTNASEATHFFIP